MSIKRNLIALRPPTANAWYRMALPDSDCTGSIIQNQDAVANFYISPRLPSSLQEAVWFPPGGVQYDDRIPWQEELWVYCDTADVALTFGRAYGQTKGVAP